MRKLLTILLLCLPMFAQRTANRSSGNITASSTDCATAGSCITANLNVDNASAIIDISGTFTATVQFEMSSDGTNWRSASATPVAGGGVVTSATAAGAWRVNISGGVSVRVRCSAFSSGPAVVSITVGNGAASTGGGVGSSASGDALVNSSGSVAGVSPGADGACVVSSGGAWVRGACSGNTSTNWSALTADGANISTGTFQIGNGTTLTTTGTGAIAATTAAKWASARNLAGNSVDGSANVAFSNKFIVQGTADSGLSGAQFLGSLGTGILKNTTTTGVLSAAAASDVVTLFNSGTCSGYLKSDGTCDTPVGSGTPGGSATQFQFNDTTFGGAANATYNKTTGVSSFNQKADTNDTIYSKRFTDTTPTGNFLHFQNAAANADLFKVDVAGNGVFGGSVTSGAAGTSPYFGGAPAAPATTAASTGAIQISSTGNRPVYGYNAGSNTNIALATDKLSLFAATSSSELAGVISDETGSGALVFGTSPTLTTPTLGVASATSINKVAITAPATGSTLTIADGKTLTASNTLTLTGTDSSSVAFGGGGTVGYVIGSGTATMGTAGISSGACASAVTVSATGVATTDVIVYTPNTDPTAVTGYGPSATGSLYIWAYPTANNVNFKVCNNTGGTITPSALTLNWRVAR